MHLIAGGIKAIRCHCRSSKTYVINITHLVGDDIAGGFCRQAAIAHLESGVAVAGDVNVAGCDQILHGIRYRRVLIHQRWRRANIDCGGLAEGL